MASFMKGAARREEVPRKAASRMGARCRQGLAAPCRLAAWRATLIREELAKALHVPGMLALPLLSLALNAALLFGHLWLRPMMVEVDAVARDSGTQIDGAFLRALERRPESELKDRLLASAENMDAGSVPSHARTSAQDVIAHMDTAVARGLAAVKYDRWLDRAGHLERTGGAGSVYAGPVTHDLHVFLFGTMVPVLIAEASLIGAAVVLYISELDARTGALSIVTTSALGRRAPLPRFAAALIIALAAYALIGAVTIGATAFALGWGMGPAWGSDVASVFNIAMQGASARPFIPWRDFTVASYMACSLVLGALIVAGLIAMAHAVSMAFGRSEVRMACLAVCTFLPLAFCKLCALLGFSTAAALLAAAPAMLLTLSSQWFTDLGAYGLLPWQETVSSVFGVAVWGVAGHWAFRSWMRRDVA